MPAPANRLKSALRSGAHTRGVWLTLASASVAEMAGHSGLDWCLIDGEHAPNTLQTIQAQLQALSGTPASAVVRLASAEPWMAKQVLDLGAQSLIFPMIHSGADAARAVAACRYPPHGVRGIGASVARVSGWGREADYMSNADDEICVIVQAESRAALDNIDDIAGTDGVDCVFVGPADLSADLGHIGNPDHREVQEAIAHIIARTMAAGKAPGLFGTVPAHFDAHARAGVKMLAVGTDSLLLNRALTALST